MKNDWKEFYLSTHISNGEATYQKNLATIINYTYASPEIVQEEYKDVENIFS